MRIPFDPPATVEAKRREAAKERAAASRASAKLRADVDGAIVEALAAMVSMEGKVSPSFTWRVVLKEARDGLEGRSYDRPMALSLIAQRLDPTCVDACSRH